MSEDTPTLHEERDPVSTLFEDARKHVELAAADLSGEEDFMPLLVMTTGDDEAVAVGIVMTADHPDALAGSITGLCAIHRAREAAFASAAWLVMPKPGENPLAVSPSEHPDRQEQVMLITVDAEGTASMKHAALIRENNMVGVGVWEEQPPGYLTLGRISHAMQLGIRMGASMPPEVAAFVKKEAEAGNMGELLSTLTSMYCKTVDEQRQKASAEKKGEGE